MVVVGRWLWWGGGCESAAGEIARIGQYESWFQEGKELYRYDSRIVSACRQVVVTYGKLLVTFIDLKKAYDSVPRNALWMALGKLGMPEQTIQFIQSFHQGMQAKIHLEGNFLEEIDVDNGKVAAWHLCY